jgi:hypothetical protein
MVSSFGHPKKKKLYLFQCTLASGSVRNRSALERIDMHRLHVSEVDMAANGKHRRSEGKVGCSQENASLLGSTVYMCDLARLERVDARRALPFHINFYRAYFAARRIGEMKSGFANEKAPADHFVLCLTPRRRASN